MKFLLPGDVVRVKQWREIAATLDAEGALDGLPFMEEMRADCGRTFVVWRRIEKICAEADGMRRMKGTVMLGDSFCSGACHGGCEKRCRILWKESWLEPADPARASHKPESAAGSAETPAVVPAAGIGEKCSAFEGMPPAPGTEAALRPEGGGFSFPSKREDGRWSCQSTELMRATAPLSKADVRQYVRDVRTRTWTLREMLRFAAVAVKLRVRVLVRGMGSVRLRSDRTKTPSEALELRPGEWVEVKSREEIAQTLDRGGRNRGLEFPLYMLPFLGRRFQVERRVSRIILETSGEMRELKHTVVLRGVTCDGYGRWGGCPRDACHFWREIWLRRVDTEERPGTRVEGPGTRD